MIGATRVYPMRSTWRKSPLFGGGLLVALALAVGLVGYFTAEADPSSPVAPAASPSSARAAPGPVAVFSLPWGGGPQALGHRVPREGAPEGPSSFAVDRRGAVWVLDQVNERVQVVFRGRVARTLSIPTDTYQDLDVLPDGTLVLVDRLVQRHVALRTPAGSWRFAPVEGPGVPVGGGVTGLFALPDGLWLEWAHTRLVRVADRQGRADPRRPVRWGRPAGGGGALVRAVRAGPGEVVVLRRDGSRRRVGTHIIARLGFALPVAQLLALESDDQGRIYVVAHLLDRDPVDPARVRSERLEVVSLAPQGRERFRRALPVNDGPEEQLRSFRVGRDGALYQLRFDANGATLWRVTP